MDVYLTTPTCSVSPWTLMSYPLNVETIKFSLSSEINLNPITDRETLLFNQSKHSRTEISVSGQITKNSSLPGTTIYEKRDNIIAAAVKWGINTDVVPRSNCAQLIYKGNNFYVIIERAEFEQIPGSEEINFSITFIQNEGADL